MSSDQATTTAPADASADSSASADITDPAPASPAPETAPEPAPGSSEGSADAISPLSDAAPASDSPGDDESSGADEDVTDDEAEAEEEGVAEVAAPEEAKQASDWFGGLWGSFAGAAGITGDAAASNEDAGVESGSDSVQKQMNQIGDMFWKSIGEVGKNVEGISEKLKTVDPKILEDMKKRSEEVLKDASAGIEKLGQVKLDDVIQEGQRGFTDVFDPGATASPSAGASPWGGLPDDEKHIAEPLQTLVQKIVVDSIYSRAAREEHFVNPSIQRAATAAAASGVLGFDATDEAELGRAAMGALEADGNLKRLRAGLVPRLMKERAFWDAYFYHVHRVKVDLLAGGDGGVGDEEEDGKGEEEEDDLDALLGEGGEEKSKGGKGKAGKKGGKERDWDEEIDKIFDEDSD